MAGAGGNEARDAEMALQLAQDAQDDADRQLAERLADQASPGGRVEQGRDGG